MTRLPAPQSKAETIRQMMTIDKSMADTITRRLEIESERKVINTKWKQSPEYRRLKELAKEEKQLIIEQHEKNGARKMIYALMQKFGIKTPDTHLTKLTGKNEAARALAEA
jgi:hypothetical protein